MRAYAGAIDDKDNIGGEENEDKPTQADLLVDIGLTTHLFLDQHGVGHTQVTLNEVCTDNTDGTYSKPCTCTTEQFSEKNSGNKVYNTKSIVSGVSAVKYRFVVTPLNSSRFKEWLAERMHTLFNKTPNSTAIKSAITTLSGIARKRNISYKLYNRVAPDPNGNGIWIDMCDKNWRAIHVTEEGWEIEDRTPVPMFRRFKQGPSAVPVKVKREATAALKLLDFLNLKTDEDRLIFICSIISYFIPEIEHPALSASGPHGSAKTMAFEFAKKIIDPLTQNPETETISMARKENVLAQQLYHIYFSCFDNVSSLKGWQSDMLCRAVTGGAILKRKLYTDDEDIIYQFRRCVGFNGINVPARNSDLLDRTIIFVLEGIDENNRISKLELLAEFEKEKPYILGGMLSVVSKALKIKKGIKLKRRQRLADFHEWGCAIAVALGYTAERFNEAYNKKVELQNEEALSSSSTATALIEYLKANLDEVTCESEDGSLICTIEKTPTDWFRELTSFAKAIGIKTSKGYWATDASHFSRELNKVKPNLEKVGIRIQRYSDGSSRSIIIDVTELMKKIGTEPFSKKKSEDDNFWAKAIESKKSRPQKLKKKKEEN